MRIPLTWWGAREILLITLPAGGATVTALAGVAMGCVWCWPLLIVAALVWVGGLLFFRDPERCTPSGTGLFVAAADGRITEVGIVENDPWIGGPATRLSIFLSVLDVHVNRSPCAGVVRAVEYQPGQFLDARDPESGARNEANTIVIEPDEPGVSTVVVRQIAGKIARRIVCAVRPGDRVERGQRIGMIKFGSRTELIIAGQGTCEPTVKVGDRARGAVTVMARIVRKPSQG
ncbi:MAG TPA: phosphatidylserine decarboxylase [Phycisphaerae bacterium]|nr:phosphatidylserine decarboxylase [Phycisphaerae bacterium]